jgi:hypothetical protein
VGAANEDLVRPIPIEGVGAVSAVRRRAFLPTSVLLMIPATVESRRQHERSNALMSL